MNSASALRLIEPPYSSLTGTAEATPRSLGRAQPVAQQRPALQQADGGIDQPVHQEKGLLLKVLVVEQAHGLVELDVGKGAPLPARLALVVQHRHVGIVPHLPAPLLGSVAEIQVFGVHKVLLVQQANLGQRPRRG